METGYPPYDGSYLTGHGSEWMIMRDMLSAGVALYDEYPNVPLCRQPLLQGTSAGTQFWYAGHAFHQGSAYAETRVSAELYPLWIFDRMGFSGIYNPSQQFVPYSWIYMRRPGWTTAAIGDGQFKSPKLRSLLIASYYGDGYVLGDYLRDPGIDDMNKYSSCYGEIRICSRCRPAACRSRVIWARRTDGWSREPVGTRRASSPR